MKTEILHEQSSTKQAWLYPLWTLPASSGKVLERPWTAVAEWYHTPTSYPELERASTVGFRTASFSLGDS